MKSDPIKDFILKSEHNLSIASAVSEAWPEAREKLISDFLDRLRMKLLKQLKGWNIQKSNRFFIDPHAEVSICKPQWKKYWLVFQCDRYGEKNKFGVARDGDMKNRPYCEELFNAVKDISPSARIEKPWWEAQMIMRSPAPDWRKPDVLWRMHSEKEFLDDVAEQLLQVAKITEPIIDRLSKKK